MRARGIGVGDGGGNEVATVAGASSDSLSNTFPVLGRGVSLGVLPLFLIAKFRSFGDFPEVA